MYAIIGSVFAALTSILEKIGMEGVDSNVATFLRTIVILVFAWAIVFFQGTYKNMKSISKKGYLFLILSGMATGLSWLCYFAAIASPLARFQLLHPLTSLVSSLR